MRESQLYEKKQLNELSSSPYQTYNCLTSADESTFTNTNDAQQSHKQTQRKASEY